MQTRKGMGNSHADLLSGFDWNSVDTVVDIGGGHGTTSMDIVKNTVSTRCVVQDLPNVIEGAKEPVSPELDNRISFMGHDFFMEQPVKEADVYFFRWILHDWSDDRASLILRNLIPALKPGANIVLQEMIMPEPGTMPFFHEKNLR